MRKIAFLIGLSCMLFAQFLDAQITTEEAPPIFDLYMSSLKGVNLNTSEQSLPSPDMKTIEMEDRANDGKRGGPLRFAYPVKVHYTLTNSGRWFDLKDGSKLWRLKVRLPGALSTNTSYDVFRLPKGAKFYVYSEDTKQYIGAITSEYLPVYESSNIPYAFATGLIYGETVTFEYYQPATVRDNAIISICRIDYGYRFIDNPYINTDITRSKAPGGYGTSGKCQVDVNCPEGQNWKREKDAVARILVKSEFGSHWCSCALINNTLNNNTPYVLTANHCLEASNGTLLFDAERRSNLPDWVFYWGYERPSCKTGEPIERSTTGAEVIANGDADFALLRLKQDPRNLIGFNPYYLGWDRSGNSGTGGVGIHHPKGDVKKIATLNHTPNNGWNGKSMYWSFYWDATPNGHSVTEGGSSGSPLINNNRHLIGQLYGIGERDCDTPNQDISVYGKFSFSWNGDPTSNSRKRRLRDWLDPANINPQTWNGVGVINASPSISGPTTVLNQETYTIQNMPSGSSVRWSTNNRNLQLVSGQGTKTAVFRKNGSGECVIQATIRPSNLTVMCRVCVLPSRPIRIDGIRNGQQFGPGSIVSFSINDVGDANSITWDVRGGRIYSGQGTRSISVEVATESGPLSVHVTKRNNCGSISFSEIGAINPNAAVQSISLSPNPATDVVTLKLTEGDDGILSPQGQGSTTKGVTSTYEIQLWNGLTMLRSFKTNQLTFQIPIAGLPTGLYFVRVIKDGQTYTEKLIKN